MRRANLREAVTGLCEQKVAELGFEPRPSCSKVKAPSAICVHVCVCVCVCVCLYLELWRGYSSKQVGLSGVVSFTGKREHDFVGRKVLGSLRAEYLKDVVVRRVCVCVCVCVCRW